MPHRQELRPSRLRVAEVPPATTIVVRGGPDTRRTLRDAATDMATRYTLDGEPFFGVSVRAIVGGRSLAEVLVERFFQFPKIYLPTYARIADAGFALWPTFRSADHYDVQLHSASDDEVDHLLAAFGPEMDNPAWKLKQERA